MEEVLRAQFYKPGGYQRQPHQLLEAARRKGHSLNIGDVRRWLEKQAIWQVYRPAPRQIHYAPFDEKEPNRVHQADVLYLPHDGEFKYALTIVDVASRYKGAAPLSEKSSKAVAEAFQQIYDSTPLKWPHHLQVDAGKEFRGEVTTLMTDQGVTIRRATKGHHRGQAIAERFNRTLAERIFDHQYAQEMAQPVSEKQQKPRVTGWVDELPEIVEHINSMKTRMIGLAPDRAITMSKVVPAFAQVYKPRNGADTTILPMDVMVRYLYEPGELEGGSRRATDPVWSLNVYMLDHVIEQAAAPHLYYLKDGPKRGFVKEQLQVIPADTELPPRRE